jgi:hypothetical protein
MDGDHPGEAHREADERAISQLARADAVWRYQHCEHWEAELVEVTVDRLEDDQHHHHDPGSRQRRPTPPRDSDGHRGNDRNLDHKRPAPRPNDHLDLRPDQQHRGQGRIKPAAQPPRKSHGETALVSGIRART